VYIITLSAAASMRALDSAASAAHTKNDVQIGAVGGVAVSGAAAGDE
jgi:hypothetical protein